MNAILIGATYLLALIFISALAKENIQLKREIKEYKEHITKND